VLPSSLDVLRERLRSYIIDGKKLNTESISNILHICKSEIDEIKYSSFFSHKIVNDIFESSYNSFRNAVLSIFPYLKTNYKDLIDYSNEMRKNIEDIRDKEEKARL
jgi:effector-binding domain-containing protein